MSAHVNLDDNFQRKLFLTRLGACELAAVRATYTERQEEFLSDMRWKFDHRMDNAEVGQIWNPTTNQMNYLEGLFTKASCKCTK